MYPQKYFFLFFIDQNFIIIYNKIVVYTIFHGSKNFFLKEKKSKFHDSV